jgi:predicted nucleic acid-binding protein
MDELLGRQAARARGFAVRGSLGILVEAYRKNLMNADQLRLNVAEMARRRDMWISPDLAKRVLGETLGE